MALNRAWYNALVDDDGTNTVGTVWGKDDIKNLLDSVDAEIARLEVHPYCEVYLLNSNGQQIPSGGFTTLLFDTETTDPWSMWSAAANDKFFLPTAGVYLVSGQVWFDLNVTGSRSLRLYKNGAAVLPDALIDTNTTTYTPLQVAGMVVGAAGDYLQLAALHTSGVSLKAGGFGGPYSTNRVRIDRVY